MGCKNKGRVRRVIERGARVQEYLSGTSCVFFLGTHPGKHLECSSVLIGAMRFLSTPEITWKSACKSTA